MYNKFDYIDNFLIIYGISLDSKSPKIEQFIIEKMEKSHNSFVGDKVTITLVSKNGDKRYLTLVQKYINIEGDDLRHPIRKILSNKKEWEPEGYYMYSYMVSFDRNALIEYYCNEIETENSELEKQMNKLLMTINVNKEKISSIRNQKLYEITDEI